MKHCCDHSLLSLAVLVLLLSCHLQSNYSVFMDLLISALCGVSCHSFEKYCISVFGKFIVKTL